MKQEKKGQFSSLHPDHGSALLGFMALPPMGPKAGLDHSQVHLHGVRGVAAEIFPAQVLTKIVHISLGFWPLGVTTISSAHGLILCDPHSRFFKVASV